MAVIVLFLLRIFYAMQQAIIEGIYYLFMNSIYYSSSSERERERERVTDEEEGAEMKGGVIIINSGQKKNIERMIRERKAE